MSEVQEIMAIAAPILTRAVELDNAKRYTESLESYQAGISVLLESSKKLPQAHPKKPHITNKIREYMERAEKVKVHMDDLKKRGTYREQISIGEDKVGFSYDTVFARFLDEDVTLVEIDDPYVRSVHQCDNLVRFLELCARKCKYLRVVKLTTGRDPNPSSANEQSKRLDTINKSLRAIPGREEVQLYVEYSDSLHDREIRIDNGWVIKVGRGLDYFKPVDRFNIGFTDFEFRPCRETTIDVFHRKELVRLK